MADIQDKMIMLSDQPEEPHSNAINIFFNWLYPRCVSGAIHEVYLPGRGFVGRKFERCYNDIERICFGQNFNRERFGNGDNVFQRPMGRNVLCDKVK